MFFFLDVLNVNVAFGDEKDNQGGLHTAFRLLSNRGMIRLSLHTVQFLLSHGYGSLIFLGWIRTCSDYLLS